MISIARAVPPQRKFLFLLLLLQFRPEADEEGSDGYDKAALDDIGYNAELYIFHQLVVQD